MLKINHLTKIMDNQTILDNLNIEIKDKEITSIIGHSGAGKTTLLRILNGLTPVTEGEILLNNNPIKTEDITLVFQNFNLFPHLTVLDNLILALKLKNKKEKDKYIEDARRWLTLLKIADKENQYPNKLSGGEKQRIAIARACMLNPKIICFDEPTSALDPNLVGEVTNMIKKLKEENLTILIITHDMQFAKRVSDRIITLDKGKIIENLTL